MMPLKRKLSDESPTVAKRLPVFVPTTSIPPTLPGILSLPLADLERPTSDTLIHIYAEFADVHGKLQTARTCLDRLGDTTPLTAPKETLHCVRCHEDFNEASNRMDACGIDHYGECRRMYKDMSGSRWDYDGCGCKIKVEDYSEPTEEEAGFCFVGSHTTDTNRVRYRPHGSAQTCQEMECEWSEKSETAEDDYEIKAIEVLI